MTSKNQQIYDHVYTTLHSQGFKRCVDTPEDTNFPPNCMLRNKDGYVCAVGSLIDPAKHSPSLEGLTITYLLHHRREEFLPRFHLGPENQQLLYHLQTAHDDSFSPDNMAARLHDVAVEYSLTPH